MDPPPARRPASKRRDRRRRQRRSAAAAGAGVDVQAGEQGSTAPGKAAAAASSSRRRDSRRRRRRDRAAKAAAAAVSKNPDVSATLRGRSSDAQGDQHDTANRVSDVLSVQGDCALQAGCCLEAVEADLGDSFPQKTAKKIVNSNKTSKRNIQTGNKTTKVSAEDVAGSSLSRENSVGEIEALRSQLFKKSHVRCPCDTSLENADIDKEYLNKDPKCPVMENTDLSGDSEEVSRELSSMQEPQEHKENENGASFNSSNLKEEKKEKRKKRGRKKRDHCRKTTSQDCPLPAGTDDSDLMTMVSQNNTSSVKPKERRKKQDQNEISMTNSVSVDGAKTAEGESVNLHSAIEKRCELGRNLECTNTERNELQEQDLACLSEDRNVNCLSPSNLAEAYMEKLKVAFSPGRSLLGFPKKKLLILDLNGLLADINQDYHNAHMADAKVRGKLVFRRPYCDDFLKFCSQNFDLGIWSSRKKENVASVVNIVMREFKPRLLFCWDMSKCTFTGCKTLENMHKPLVLKELRKLWNKEEPDLPWEEGDYSPSNTLLVDDSPYKALRNPPHTAIFPRSYSYLNWNDNSLGPGGDLRKYLRNLAAADDVESYVCNNPFGQPFITECDPHWNFYAQIAGKVSAIADKGSDPLTCYA